MTVRDLFGLQLEAARVREATHRALGLALSGTDTDLIRTFQALLEAALTAERAVLATTLRTSKKVVPIKRRTGR